jgi:hypothetical protein
LEVLPDGSLVAAWFSGAHEGSTAMRMNQPYLMFDHWSKSFTEANKCAIVVAKLDISSNQYGLAVEYNHT